MKKIGLFILILLIPSTLAISIDKKESYNPGENLITEIHGNILELIKKENIILKRNNVQVPFDYDFKQLGGKYFLFAKMPNFENNYTLIIKDIKTTVQGVPQIIDHYENISVSGELAPYSIKPKLTTTSKDFEIIVNLNKDLDETISTNFPEEREIILEPGENIINFQVDNTQLGLQNIDLGMYSFPAMILNKTPELVLELEFTDVLRFVPNSIEGTLFIDEIKSLPFRIANVGGEAINNITLDFDEALFEVSPKEIESLEAGDTLELSLTTKTSGEQIFSTLFAISENLAANITINITYTEVEEEVVTPYLEEDYSEIEQYYCSEIEGKSCTEEEECSVPVRITLDYSNCCTGSCELIEEEQSYAWVGYLIGAIILIILIIVLAKFYKSKKIEKNPLKKRISEVEKRNSTSLPSSYQPFSKKI
ncbi:hypothetical protein CXT76_01080 [Candidatus Parvarchaeota archaeon]|jgi:hypothetical protein|nr:MAG: hypothetical protein CXT76_01080 [Candidatus Parvarchaeota archaeon]HIG52230.1 hypothetical protein [Candidatus Pacearchaeota archaeon]